MFSSRFGLKLGFGYDEIKSQNGSGSLKFNNKQYQIGLQGVANLSRVLNFESFTNRFGLLAHGGVQISKYQPQMGVNQGISEDNGGIMIGLTPQIRLTNWAVITGDFTVINNIRQHFNWDGAYSSEDQNLTGLLYNTNLGITFYLGKNEKHADWYPEGAKNGSSTDLESRKRLDQIEAFMNYTDRDGVLDYIDAQNNTPIGVVVDAKGR